MGQTAYFGPAVDSLNYFAALGHIPEGMVNPADYLLEVCVRFMPCVWTSKAELVFVAYLRLISSLLAKKFNTGRGTNEHRPAVFVLALSLLCAR